MIQSMEERDAHFNVIPLVSRLSLFPLPAGRSQQSGTPAATATTLFEPRNGLHGKAVA